MSRVHPSVDTIKSLTSAAGILSLIIAILLGIVGLISMPLGVGAASLVLAVINYLIYANCMEIMKLVDLSRYREAKEKTLIWMLVGFIFGWILVGILLLIAFLKYDEVIKYSEPPPPPPPPPPVPL